MEVHAFDLSTRRTLCGLDIFADGTLVRVEEDKVDCPRCKVMLTGEPFEPFSKHPIDVKAASHHPSHYNTGDIEVIDAIDDWQLGFYEGNVVKYVARAGHKESDKALQDLVKARWYLNRLIVHSGGEDWNPEGTFRNKKNELYPEGVGQINAHFNMLYGKNPPREPLIDNGVDESYEEARRLPFSPERRTVIHVDDLTEEAKRRLFPSSYDDKKEEANAD